MKCFDERFVFLDTVLRITWRSRFQGTLCGCEVQGPTAQRCVEGAQAGVLSWCQCFANPTCPRERADHRFFLGLDWPLPHWVRNPRRGLGQTSREKKPEICLVQQQLLPSNPIRAEFCVWMGPGRGTFETLSLLGYLTFCLSGSGRQRTDMGTKCGISSLAFLYSIVAYVGQSPSPSLPIPGQTSSPLRPLLPMEGGRGFQEAKTDARNFQAILLTYRTTSDPATFWRGGAGSVFVLAAVCATVCSSGLVLQRPREQTISSYIAP